MITRRSAFAAFAAALAAPIAAATVAHAQTGGIPSTTAPSNSEGTPSSSTGVVGATRVGPATTDPAPRTTRRRRRHHRHHRTTTTTTTPQ